MSEASSCTEVTLVLCFGIPLSFKHVSVMAGLYTLLIRAVLPSEANKMAAVFGSGIVLLCFHMCLRCAGDSYYHIPQHSPWDTPE
jgi:hypothetical protein